MVVKVYISGISGNKEVKKRQQRVLLILDSKNVQYELVDIAEPENEDKKDFMHNNSKSSGATISDPSPRHPLPPQLFNDDDYCGDYDQFDMANEVDEMDKFLKLAPSNINEIANAEIKLGNGEILNENETKEELKDDNNVDVETKAEENGEEKQAEQNEAIAEVQNEEEAEDD